MTAQLRSEWLKQRSTRTTLVLLGWMVAITLLVVGLHVLSFGADDLSREGNQAKILGLGTTVAALFAALLGAMSITSEFRTGTIRPTFLVAPRRTRVLAAKAIAGMLAGACVGLGAAALTAGAEVAGLAARGIDIELGTAECAQLLAGGSLTGALFAAIGVGVGAIARNQVAAVTGVCVWLLFLEPLLLGNVPSAGRYAPVASAGAVTGAIQTQIADALVAPALGVALLAGYAALAGVAGCLLITRRDVG